MGNVSTVLSYNQAQNRVKQSNYEKQFERWEKTFHVLTPKDDVKISKRIFCRTVLGDFAPSVISDVLVRPLSGVMIEESEEIGLREVVSLLVIFLLGTFEEKVWLVWQMYLEDEVFLLRKVIEGGDGDGHMSLEAFEAFLVENRDLDLGVFNFVNVDIGPLIPVIDDEEEEEIYIPDVSELEDVSFDDLTSGFLLQYYLELMEERPFYVKAKYSNPVMDRRTFTSVLTPEIPLDLATKIFDSLTEKEGLEYMTFSQFAKTIDIFNNDDENDILEIITQSYDSKKQGVIEKSDIISLFRSLETVDDYFYPKEEFDDPNITFRMKLQIRDERHSTLAEEALCHAKDDFFTPEEFKNWFTEHKGFKQLISLFRRILHIKIGQIPLDIEKERSIIANLIEEGQQKSLEGTQSFVIPMSWWRKWKKFVHWDQNEKPEKVERPGVIDTKPIIFVKKFSLFGGKKQSLDDVIRLKDGLVEDVDFVVIPRGAFVALQAWYSCDNPVSRKTVLHQQQTIIELYPIFFQIEIEPPITLLRGKKIAEGEFSCSRYWTLKDYKKALCSKVTLRALDRVRLWMQRGNNLTLLEDQLDSTLEELGFVSGDKIIIERQDRDGTWPRGNPEEDKEIILYDVTPGDSGLKNLGNTCFMNSSLQCLSNTVILRDYFVSNRYLAELNIENFMGYQGNVANVYAHLVKEMWPDDIVQSPFKNSVVVPKTFKRTIGKYAEQFNDFRQQDAQEFLNFIVDALHEDLNRIIDKPYVMNPDYEGQPDIELGNEYWDNYRKRNDSIISDLFAGQLRSKVEYEGCGHCSVTFDPFTFLSLPLPMDDERPIEVVFFYADPKKKAQKTSILIDRDDGTISQLMSALSNLVDVPEDQILLAEVEYSYLEGYIDINSSFQKLRDQLTAFEVLSRTDVEDEIDVCNIPILHRKLHTTKNYFISPYASSIFSTPSVLSLDKNEHSFKDVYDLVLEQIENMVDISRPKNRRILEQNSYPFILRVTNRKGTACGNCPWYHFCPGCIIEISDVKIEHVFNEDSTICIDWIPDRYDLLYNKAENKNWFEEHPSIEENRIAQNRPISLDQCVNWFKLSENLGEDIFCSQCQDRKVAHKKMDLWKIPNIVIIHLKRFQYYNNRWRKSNRTVEYPLEDLDLLKFLPDEKRELELEEGNHSTYKLYGIVNHFGALGGGHYTAFCKHADKDLWYHYDDSYIKKVKNIDDLIHPAGYLLFYVRDDLDINSLLPGEPITDPEIIREKEAFIPLIELSSEEEQDNKKDNKKCSMM